ncbi:hypothetical protein PSACC_03438 [Paramicrosporidium saccamoebae]|uniref:RING-type E3 ubiquitin transferase n=1 Tax=Paramicrosporidium saccamoebae TaxID=1246581 RepID=A0A2H9TG34_9FUNG|nr:hypothetical protein PSACC_03438 [Paramicrosporidium saccamoebae]
MDKLSSWTPKEGLVVEYLIGCFNRIERSGQNDRLATELKYLLVSYMGLVSTMPTMFSQPAMAEEYGARILVPMLTGIDRSGELLSPKLLGELVGRFSDDGEQMADLFEPVLLGIVASMQKEGLLGRFISGMDALYILLQHAEVRKLLVASDSWKANCDALNLGGYTILGGVLSVGVDPIELGPLLELLPNRETLYVPQVESAFYSMRTALNLHFGKTHQLLYSLIKSGERESVLDWLGWLAARNNDRLKMHVDPKTVTPDRVLANCYAVLLKFCEPFLSPSSPKISMIDGDYYCRSSRINVSEATKNHATNDEYKEYIQQADTTNYAPNFVTECFFLTVQYFRLGPIRMMNEYMDLLRNLREAQQALDSFERSQAEGSTNPMNNLAIKNAKAQIQKMKDSKLALDVYLLDPTLMENGFSFVTFIVRWMLTLLPDELTSTPPVKFAMLPEFLVESVGEFSLFISRFHPQFWLDKQLDILLKFMVTLLDRPTYVKNPYLRSKFVDFLYGFTDPRLEHYFDLYPMVVDQLAGKLMRFYIEVESTGASSSFYDKFNIRYNISKIFKTCWGHPSHRSRIIACSQDNELFIRFVNLLVNDVTFLLDESISKLADIHSKQNELSTWSNRPPNERQEVENGLRTLERQCESYLQLATSTLDMLEYFTSEILDPFVRPEVVDRLAAMLCHNILQMVGPKCTNLKVQTPEKYHWEPRVVLRLLVGSLLNMSRRETFLQAVARDTRSFSVETFSRATAILRRHSIRTPSDIARLERIATRVAAIAEQAEEMEVPDEFLDPLMFTVMREPVRLPTSNMVVDRSTIVAHLLNDPTDPFNRKPLTLEETVPEKELADRIAQFLKRD